MEEILSARGKPWNGACRVRLESRILSSPLILAALFSRVNGGDSNIVATSVRLQCLQVFSVCACTHIHMYLYSSKSPSFASFNTLSATEKHISLWNLSLIELWCFIVTRSAFKNLKNLILILSDASREILFEEIYNRICLSFRLLYW